MKPPIRGMLDVEALKQMVEAEQIETVLAVFPDIYSPHPLQTCSQRNCVAKQRCPNLHGEMGRAFRRVEYAHPCQFVG